MESNFIELLKKIGLSKEIGAELASKLTETTLKKNEYFIKYGQKMNKIGILYKGVLVSRYSSDEGKEVASKFYYPLGDTIVVDYYCFKNQLNSDEQIQAIEESNLLTLSFEEYNILINKYPAIQKAVISFTEKSYLKALNRIRDFQLLDAETRVKQFVEHHQTISDKVLVRDKASYLGISRNIFTKSLKKIKQRTL